MNSRAVFLVGFMASGKTCVGRELAQRLGWDFVDLDARIEAREQQTVQQLFRERGESGFRVAETDALRDLLSDPDRSNRVIALGGGAFVQSENRGLLRRWPSVFLEATASELWQRSVSDGVSRPLRQDPEQFAQLYAERLSLYREASVTVVTSGKDLDTVCGEITDILDCWDRDRED